MKIAISTGGGDAPGLNAVIRGAVLSAIHRGWECVGIRRGYGGLLGDDGIVPLGAAEVRGITHLGGTILGTSNPGDPFKFREPAPGGGGGGWNQPHRSRQALRALPAPRPHAIVANRRVS